YYLGGRHLGGEAMSWRPTCAALLPDGSIAVALEASDWRLVPSSQTGPTVDPASLPRLAGLCRLVPPDFILDTSMDGGGVALHVPGREFRTRADQKPSQQSLELQTPSSIRAFPDGSVVCAIRLLGMTIPQTFGGLFLQMPPDRQWFDGSVAAVRFI